MAELKFKKGDRVRIVGSHLDSKGATGRIIDVDPDWDYPYEVMYDDKELNEAREKGLVEELFCDDDLELYVEEKPKSVKELPVTSKLLLIRDLKGSGDTDGIRNASIIDLEKGVNRLNLRTNVINDLVWFIKNNEPTQIIFEIHDGDFRKLLSDYINFTDCEFTIDKNGVVTYSGGVSHGE